MVKVLDSRSRDRGFESWRRILDGKLQQCNVRKMEKIKVAKFANRKTNDNYYYVNGLVVKAVDSRSRGHGFEFGDGY